MDPVAVAAVAVPVGVVAFGGSDKGSGREKTPKSTVPAYLNDLAEGDANGALSCSAAAPPAITFLSDEILKQQQAKDKITNIDVTDVRQTDDQADVHATCQFGPKSADDSLLLTKVDGKWELTDAIIKINVAYFTHFQAWGRRPMRVWRRP